MEYIFIIYLFSDINVANISYKASQTWESLTSMHPIASFFWDEGSSMLLLTRTNLIACLDA
jgi:hypothetical protein